MEDLERDMATEVEIIRSEARDREETLRRQLEESRMRLSQEAERRETLLDQVQDLQSRLTRSNEDESPSQSQSQSGMQLKLQNQFLSQSQNISESITLQADNTLYFRDGQNMERDHLNRFEGQRRQNRYTGNMTTSYSEYGGEDDVEEDRQVEEIEWEINHIHEERGEEVGENEEDVVETADLSAFFLVGDTGDDEVVDQGNKIQPAADTTVVSTTDDSVGINCDVESHRGNGNHYASVVSPAGSLQERQGDNGYNSGDERCRKDELGGGNHKQLLREISRLREREAFLQRGLEQQTAKLALVLRRAAQMMPHDVRRDRERSGEEGRDRDRDRDIHKERERVALVIGEKESQLLSLRSQLEILRQQVDSYIIRHTY